MRSWCAAVYRPAGLVTAALPCGGEDFPGGLGAEPSRRAARADLPSADPYLWAEHSLTSAPHLDKGAIEGGLRGALL